MIKVLLLDIEGTTTSIAFVKETLFPLFEEGIHKFLTENYTKIEVSLTLADLNDTSIKESSTPLINEFATLQKNVENLVSYIKAKVHADQKLTPLKTLQGLLWESLYKSKKVKGHIYQDVPKFLKSTFKNDVALYVYSSGSVNAQKLLFRYSEFGNLDKLFKGNFDTKTSGGKLEVKSYERIVEEVRCDAKEILFLSDNVKELLAAHQAGLNTLNVNRPGNEKIEIIETERVDGGVGGVKKETKFGGVLFNVVEGFDEIDLNNAGNGFVKMVKVKKEKKVVVVGERRSGREKRKIESYEEEEESKKLKI